MSRDKRETVIRLTLEIAFQTLAAYPEILAKRITSLAMGVPTIGVAIANRRDAPVIFPYLALLHVEIARFTLYYAQMLSRWAS